jgi:hypothetical protein
VDATVVAWPSLKLFSHLPRSVYHNVEEFGGLLNGILPNSALSAKDPMYNKFLDVNGSTIFHRIATLPDIKGFGVGVFSAYQTFKAELLDFKLAERRANKVKLVHLSAARLLDQKFHPAALAREYGTVTKELYYFGTTTGPKQDHVISLCISALGVALV